MPRAIWSGSISFGLVNVPVRMYSAIDQQDVHFHLLHATDNSRIGYDKICKKEGTPVPDDEIVKGYEVAEGRYVHVTDEDLEAAAGESHRMIDRKRKGKDVHVEPRPEREEPADLLEALRASVEAHRGPGRTGKRRNGSLGGLTKSELDEQARKAGIAGRSRMTKKELVEALGSD